MDAYLVQSGGSGGSSTPLRFASASNQFPTNAPSTFNLGTGAAQTDVYVNQKHVIGQDMTTMVLGMTMQYLKASVGVSNIGNSITIMEMALSYNGTFVAVTSGGQGSWTVADTANWQSDPITSTSLGGAAKFTKGTNSFVRVRFRTNAPTTDKFPLGRSGQAGVEQVIFADPAKTNFTVGVMGTAQFAYSMTNGGVNGTDAKFGNSVVPVFCLGYHSKPSVLFLGDSKTYGTGDTAPTVGVVGMNRALFTDVTTPTSVQCSGMNCGCQSGFALETYTATASGIVANFEYWYTLANYAVVGYGTNNISAPNQTTMYGRIRANGITPIIQRSLTPRTTPLSSMPVSITSLTTDGSTTTVTGTMADTSGLQEGQSYPISGATPATYNGTFAIHIVNGTTFTYTAGSVPASNATGTLVLDDQWRTLQYQVINASWGVGSIADTFEQFLRGNVSTDASFTYYQSTGERASAALGTTNYWKWLVNGTAKYVTSDGLHEGGTYPGYELNVGSGGTVTTQAGGTVAQTLRALVGTLA